MDRCCRYQDTTADSGNIIQGVPLGPYRGRSTLYLHSVQPSTTTTTTITTVTSSSITTNTTIITPRGVVLVGGGGVVIMTKNMVFAFTGLMGACTIGNYL